jgi:hypothetical protein
VFGVGTEFTVPTGKRSEHPRGMPLVTRTHARKSFKRSKGVKRIGILECKFLSKTYLPLPRLNSSATTLKGKEQLRDAGSRYAHNGGRWDGCGRVVVG